MFKLHSKNKILGFALVEIMIVAAVTSFLTSIIIPSLNEARQKGEDSRRTSSLRNLQTTIAEETNVGSLPYTNIFTTGKVKDQVMRFLSNTNIAEADVDMKADAETYAFVFPLKSGRYHCIDSDGVHKDVQGRIVATSGPYSCALALGVVGTDGTDDQPQIVSGARDMTFPNVITNGIITAAAFQEDGKLIIVGDFTDVNDVSSQIGISFPGVARLNADGTIDTDFLINLTNTGFSDSLDFTAVGVHPQDQTIYIGDSDIVQVVASDGKLLSQLARGAYDIDFLPSGEIVTVDGSGVQIYSSDGSLLTENTFSSDQSLKVYHVAVSSSDIIVAGIFNEYKREVVHNIVRLSSDGTLIAAPVPSFDTDGIHDIVADSPVTGSIYVVGEFSGYASNSTIGVVHLNADLSLDTNWRIATGGKSGQDDAPRFRGFTSDPASPWSVVSMHGNAVIVGDMTGYDSNNIKNIIQLDSATGALLQKFEGILYSGGEPTQDIALGVEEGVPSLVLKRPVDGKIVIIGESLVYHGTEASQIVQIYPY